MLEDRTSSKPTIKIFCAPDVDPLSLKTVVLGIEEEHIPCEIENKNNSDVISLSFEASQGSRLGVGLGLNREYVALHHEKLNPSKPLFKISAQSVEDKLRAIGANAARLVKKLPFKPL